MNTLNKSDATPFRIRPYAKRGESKWGHAISVSALRLGDGEVDQTAQDARFKGEFDSNWLFIIGANLQYRF